MTEPVEPVDLAAIGARIQSLTARLGAIGDAADLAVRLEEACNAGYGAALALEAESRRTRRGILTATDASTLELIRTLDALELASRELRRSLTCLRTHAERLGAPCAPGL
jgi:hypothetical protein